MLLPVTALSKLRAVTEGSQPFPEGYCRERSRAVDRPGLRRGRLVDDVMAEGTAMQPSADRRIASSLDFSVHEAFRQRGDRLRPSGEPATLRNQLRLLRAILRAARQGRPLILFSSRGNLKPDLLACVLLGFWRHRPAIVLVGEMWQPSAGPVVALERLAVRLADRAVDRYLVLSRAEADLLPHVWPMTAGKMRVRPFYFEPSEHGLSDDAPVPPCAGRVVAGGDSFRDYGPLLAAARLMPDVSFLLVTTTLGGVDLPPNVEVRSVPYAEYCRLLSSAAVVAVPVQTGLRRSAGLLIAIMGMWLGRPTVATTALAMDEYVVDGVTGVLVDGSADAWREALTRLLGDPDEAERLGRAARRTTREAFTFDRYVRGILAELDEAIAERAAAAEH
jgi:glycosyltransferase involved in cell wall biosynthesis